MSALRGNCTDYVTWLEYELGERQLAFQIVDNILYSKRYGGANRLCSGCPVVDSCLRSSDSVGWWGNASPRERRVRLAHDQLEALAQARASVPQQEVLPIPA